VYPAFFSNLSEQEINCGEKMTEKKAKSPVIEVLQKKVFGMFQSGTGSQ